MMHLIVSAQSKLLDWSVSPLDGGFADLGLNAAQRCHPDWTTVSKWSYNLKSHYKPPPGSLSTSGKSIHDNSFSIHHEMYYLNCLLLKNVSLPAGLRVQAIINIAFPHIKQRRSWSIMSACLMTHQDLTVYTQTFLVEVILIYSDLMVRSQIFYGPTILRWQNLCSAKLDTYGAEMERIDEMSMLSYFITRCQF